MKDNLKKSFEAYFKGYVCSTYIAKENSIYIVELNFTKYTYTLYILVKNTSHYKIVGSKLKHSKISIKDLYPVTVLELLKHNSKVLNFRINCLFILERFKYLFKIKKNIVINKYHLYKHKRIYNYINMCININLFILNKIQNLIKNKI